MPPKTIAVPAGGVRTKLGALLSLTWRSSASKLHPEFGSAVSLAVEAQNPVGDETVRFDRPFIAVIAAGSWTRRVSPLSHSSLICPYD